MVDFREQECHNNLYPEETLKDRVSAKGQLRSRMASHKVIRGVKGVSFIGGEKIGLKEEEGCSRRLLHFGYFRSNQPRYNSKSKTNSFASKVQIPLIIDSRLSRN